MKHHVVLSIAREIEVSVTDETNDEEVQAAVDAAVSELVKVQEGAGWEVTIDSVEPGEEEDEDYLEDDEEDDEEE